jgi:hypothetical protein
MSVFTVFTACTKCHTNSLYIYMYPKKVVNWLLGFYVCFLCRGLILLGVEYCVYMDYLTGREDFKQHLLGSFCTRPSISRESSCKYKAKVHCQLGIKGTGWMTGVSTHKLTCKGAVPTVSALLISDSAAAEIIKHAHYWRAWVLVTWQNS